MGRKAIPFNHHGLLLNRLVNHSKPFLIRFIPVRFNDQDVNCKTETFYNLRYYALKISATSIKFSLLLSDETRNDETIAYS